MNTVTSKMENSTATTVDWKHLDPVTMVFRTDAFLFSVACIIGIMVNVLVIGGIAKSIKMRYSGFFVCLLVLAVIDILYLLNLPLMVVELSNRLQWDFGLFLCKLFELNVVFGTVAKKFMLIAICSIHVHRIRLIRGEDFMFNNGMAVIMILVICLLALCVAIPGAIFTQVMTDPGTSKYYCTLTAHLSPYHLLNEVILPFAPEAILDIGLVVIIFFFLVCICKYGTELKASDGDGKLAAMLFTVMLIELATTVSSTILFPFYMFSAMNCFPSLIRPFMYFLFYPPLRRNAGWIITCGRCSSDEGQGEEQPLVTTRK